MRAKGRQTGKRKRGYVSASETEDEGMEKRGKKGKVVVVGTKKRVSAVLCDEDRTGLMWRGRRRRVKRRGRGRRGRRRK
jgi:hypothetical protein